jgi:hypothetical protein
MNIFFLWTPSLRRSVRSPPAVKPQAVKRQVKPSYLSSAAVQRAAFLLSSTLRAPATGVAHGPTAQLPQCQPRLSWELPQPALPQCLLAAARQSARSHGGGRRPVLAAISGDSPPSGHPPPRRASEAATDALRLLASSSLSPPSRTESQRR